MLDEVIIGDKGHDTHVSFIEKCDQCFNERKALRLSKAHSIVNSPMDWREKSRLDDHLLNWGDHS